MPTSSLYCKTSRTIRIFCKDLRETLKYVGKFSELKLNDEIQKEHTHASLSLSLSLYLPIRRCTLIFPERMCMHQSLSLSLFTIAKTVWIQTRPECNSGKNVSQIKKKIVHSIESTQSVVQKPMRTIRWVFIIYIGQSHAGQGSRGPDLLPPKITKI